MSRGIERLLAIVGVSGLLAIGLTLAGSQPASADTTPEVTTIYVHVATSPAGQRVIGKWIEREALCTSGRNFDGTVNTSTSFSVTDSFGCRVSPFVVAAYSVEIQHWAHNIVLRATQIGPGFVTTCSDTEKIKTKCSYTFRSDGVGVINLTLETSFG